MTDWSLVFFLNHNTHTVRMTYQQLSPHSNNSEVITLWLKSVHCDIFFFCRHILLQFFSLTESVFLEFFLDYRRHQTQGGIWTLPGVKKKIEIIQYQYSTDNSPLTNPHLLRTKEKLKIKIHLSNCVNQRIVFINHYLFWNLICNTVYVTLNIMLV